MTRKWWFWVLIGIAAFYVWNTYMASKVHHPAAAPGPGRGRGRGARRAVVAQ